MNTPTTWSIVSATTVGDLMNNNLQTGTAVTSAVIATSTNINTTPFHSNIHEHDHTERDQTPHANRLSRRKELPAILLDSWEIRKLAGIGSVFVNALLAADVDNDQRDEVVVGTTEGKVFVMKSTDRSPCFMHTLCATVSFLLYDSYKRELVIVTLEGQCEVLRNFCVKSPEPAHELQLKQEPTFSFPSAASSARLSFAADDKEEAGGKVHVSMRHSASSPQFNANKTFSLFHKEQPNDSFDTSINNNNNNNNTNSKYCKVERKVFFHIAANCTCGVICSNQNKINKSDYSHQASKTRTVMFAGSYDRRLYAYDMECGVCLLTLFVEHPITSLVHFTCPVMYNVQMAESVSAADLTHEHVWRYKSYINTGEQCKGAINELQTNILELLCMVIGEKVVLLPASIEEMVRDCECYNALMQKLTHISDYKNSNYSLPIHLALQTHTQLEELEEQESEEILEKEEINNNTSNVDSNVHVDKENAKTCEANNLAQTTYTTISTTTAPSSLISSLSPEATITAAGKSFMTTSFTTNSNANTNNTQLKTNFSEKTTNANINTSHPSVLSHTKRKHTHSLTEKSGKHEHDKNINFTSNKLHLVQPLCEVYWDNRNNLYGYSAHDVHTEEATINTHDLLEITHKNNQRKREEEEEKEEEFKKEEEEEEKSLEEIQSYKLKINQLQKCRSTNVKPEQEYESEENNSNDSNDGDEYRPSYEEIQLPMVVQATTHPSCDKAVIVIAREDGKMCTLTLRARQLDEKVMQEYNLSFMGERDESAKEVILYKTASPERREDTALFFYNFANNCTETRRKSENRKTFHSNNYTKLENKNKREAEHNSHYTHTEQRLHNTNYNNNSNNSNNSIDIKTSKSNNTNSLRALLQLSCNWVSDAAQTHLIPRIQLINCSNQIEHCKQTPLKSNMYSEHCSCLHQEYAYNLTNSHNDIVAFCLSVSGKAFCVNTSTNSIIYTTVRDDSSSFVITSEGVCEKTQNLHYSLKNNGNNINSSSDIFRSVSKESVQHRELCSKDNNIEKKINDTQEEQEQQKEKPEESNVEELHSKQYEEEEQEEIHKQPKSKEHYLRGLLRHFNSRSLSCFCVGANDIWMYAIDEVVQTALKGTSNNSNIINNDAKSIACSLKHKRTMNKVISNISFQSDAQTETTTSVTISPTPTLITTEAGRDDSNTLEQSEDELLLELGELIQTLCNKNNTTESTENSLLLLEEEEEPKKRDEQQQQQQQEQEKRKKLLIEQTRDLLLFGFSDQEWQ